MYFPMSHFKPVSNSQSFPKLEEQILKHWQDNQIFQKTLENRSDQPQKVFYDGPPFATGLPHYGHLLAGTIKDVIPRYHTMRGFLVHRQFGWDCHGLPVEYMVEKQLNLNGRKDIEEKYGVAEFSEKCRGEVLRFTQEWEQTVMRMGRFVDFKNDYKTMDPTFMESIWWVFGQLWEKGLIYKGFKPMHICPRCVTPLSNFEVTQGYIDVLDWSVIWQFPVKNQENTYILTWTTTPWSTPGTVAIAIGADHTYLKADIKGKHYIFVKERLDFVTKGLEENEFSIIEEIPGSDLVGLEYIPLQEHYADLPEFKDANGLYQLHATDYVEVTEGTGMVTINGAYGEIDMQATKDLDLPILVDIEMDGCFNHNNPKYQGRYVRDAEIDILNDMQEQGFVFRKEKYKHSYPHCWRCDTQLMNYATTSWFVSIDKIKEQMLKNNADVHWTPSHVGQGRFHEWLNNARDWCISRNRFWGTPLPVWESEDGDQICVKSIAELEELTGEKVPDIHKHKIDHLVITKDGKEYRRTPEILDCWFESGSMPYAQQHYPFENKDTFDQNFPAEFIAEGLDQTRGWFYTLTVLGTALFGRSPFKNVVVNGMILAEDGKKMSKRLKNYPEPAVVLDKYGADALRFYMLNSPVVKAEPIRFSEKGVQNVLKQVVLPLWNSYSFFVTYANIDNYKPEYTLPNPTNTLDKWILAELQFLLKNLTQELDNYDLQKACEPVSKFIDSLTNWYIRRSRRRFWKSENDTDKLQAYDTLHYVLVEFSKILAPFMPFVSDSIYQNLTAELSVHLADWPEYNEQFINTQLLENVATTQEVVSLALAIRARNKAKVRQPLQSLTLFIDSQTPLTQDDLDVIAEEVNVKQVNLVDSSESFAKKQLTLNARVLGKRLPTEMKSMLQAARQGEYAVNEQGLAVVAGHTLEPEEFSFRYQPLDAKSDNVDSKDNIVVQLDTTVTPELELEGLARDITRQIQEHRKSQDYQVDDKIQTTIHTTSDKLTQALETHKQFIMDETLTTSLEIKNQDPAEPIQIESHALSLTTNLA